MNFSHCLPLHVLVIEDFASVQDTVVHGLDLCEMSPGPTGAYRRALGLGPPVWRLLHTDGQRQESAGIQVHGLNPVPAPPCRGGVGSAGQGSLPAGLPALPRPGVSPGGRRASDCVAASGGARPPCAQAPLICWNGPQASGKPTDSLHLLMLHRGRLQINSRPAGETCGVSTQSLVCPPGALGSVRGTRRQPRFPPFTHLSLLWWPHDTGRAARLW